MLKTYFIKIFFNNQLLFISLATGFVFFVGMNLQQYALLKSQVANASFLTTLYVPIVAIISLVLRTLNYPMPPLILGFIGLYFIRIELSGIKQLDLLNKNINIICGHFEGVDERLLETRNIEEVSIGDLVLSGGEVGAFVVIDTVVRLLPGVLGNPNSLSEETFEKNLLEYPQYTKPQKWEEKEIPSILLTGDHEKIKDWRLARSEDITRRRRTDLWEKYNKNK